MPQVRSNAVNNTGKDSRYMTSLRFTEKALRRVNVLNALENRLNAKKVNFFQSDSAYKVKRLDRVRERLEGNLKKRMAYKLVLKTNHFSDEKDYQKALNKRYSFQAFHNDVKEMMKLMKPDLVRQRKSKLMLIENRLKYDILLNQNRQRFNKLVPEARTWIPRHLKAQYEAEQRERERLEKEREQAAQNVVEDRSKRGLATLRRRIITIDSAPNSPTKSPAIKTPALKTPTLKTPVAKTPIDRTQSPVKTPSIGKPPSHSPVKRQGITMTMMKKQKSFMETHERTSSPTEPGVPDEKDKQNSVSSSKPTDVNNNDIITSASSKQSSQKVSFKKNSATRSTAKAKNKSQPVLPPIDSHRTPRDETNTQASVVAKETDKPVKLPSLKLSQSSR